MINKKLLKYIGFILTFLCFFKPFSAYTEDADNYVETLIQYFIILDAELDEHERFFKRDNQNGGLAWQDSKILLSYIKLYEKLNEKWLLDKSIKLASMLLSFRDDETGTKDFSGEITPAWACGRYTDGNSYSHIVHSGMILYPMVRLAFLLKGKENYDSIRNKFILMAEETVNYHEKQWDEVNGCYLYRSDALFLRNPGKALPFNQQAAFGRVLLFLYLLTKKEMYRNKVTSLANYIRSNFHLTNETYIWRYRDGPFSRMDDIAHASLVVDFLSLCYLYNLEIKRIDINRLINTFKKNVFRLDLKPAKYVDGSGNGNELSLPGWLVLSLWGEDIFQIIFKYYVKFRILKNFKCNGRYFQIITNFIYFY